jgi:hypothetical protein
MPKLSLSQAWDETRAVLARDGRLFVAVALALFVLPGVVLDVVVPETRNNELPAAGAWVIVAIIAALVSLAGQIAVIRLSMQPHMTVGEAIVHGARRLLAYISAVLIWVVPILVVGSILYAALKNNPEHPSAAIGLGLIALSVVGFFLAVRMILASAVASAEPIGPIAIVRRSWDLTRGNWWRLFAFLLLFAIGAVCLLWAVESVFGLVARMTLGDLGPLTLASLLVGLVSQLVSAVLSVLFFVMLARIYLQRSGQVPPHVTVPSSGT